MRKIPPHILWPGVIVTFLVGGVASSLAIVFMARSDGGVQVVDDYYRRATEWDEAAHERDASIALGWRIEILVSQTGPQVPVSARISDTDGTPIENLTGTLALSRPQIAGSIAESTLVEVGAGVYATHLPIAVTGLWDFVVDVRQDSVRFTHTVRKEISVGQ